MKLTKPERVLRQLSARATLRRFVHQHDTLHTMTFYGKARRYVRVFRTAEDGIIQEITALCAHAAGLAMCEPPQALGSRMVIPMSGGGYNAGFEVVESVSRVFGWGTYGLKHVEL